jgi:hypothetical protein
LLRSGGDLYWLLHTVIWKGAARETKMKKSQDVKESPRYKEHVYIR